MSRNSLKFIFASAAIVLTSSLFAALPLAKNGKAAAEIVLPEKADSTLKMAAEELQHWVKAISGAKLPIVNAVSDAPQIVLDPASGNFPADREKFSGNDGYSVREKGNKVYLNAGCSKGVLNGVFRMLFKNSDIIWARPDEEFGTVYSHDKNLTLTETDYIDIPKFLLRGWQMPQRNAQKQLVIKNHLWQTRNATNWNSLSDSAYKTKFGSIVTEDGGGHNLIGRYIQERKYFKTNPEFYPLQNGKRMQPSKFKGSVQLCFTNKKMTDTFINAVDSRVKQLPQFRTYRIMTEDNRRFCECSECLKPIKLADGTVIDVKDPAFRSTQFFLFLNQIARHMKANFPGKRILTFAYTFTIIPPKCPVEDNIDISFAPIGKNAKFDLTAPQSQKTKEYFIGWSKLVSDITLREYYGLFSDFPRPVDQVAFGDWRYVYEHGVRKTYSEMHGDSPHKRSLTNPWDVNAMLYWVLTQGAWDPFQDHKALRMEFLNRVFGKEAAPDIAEYYTLIGESWLKLSGRSIWNEISHTAWLESVINKPNVAAACRAALKRAENKVKPNGKKFFAALKANFDRHMNFEAKKLIVATRTSGNPGFDPDFSTAAWVSVPAYDQFFHNAGTVRHANRTEMRMLYDDENIYIGVKCEYPDVKKMKYRPLRAGKNAVPYGEGFEVILSKKSGKKGTFHIATDPSGNRFSNNSKSKWKNEVKITDYGWCALFTIPWKDLKLTPQTATGMRGQFIRQYNQAKKEGEVPWTAAVLFTGRRRQNKFYHPVEFK